MGFVVEACPYREYYLFRNRVKRLKQKICRGFGFYLICFHLRESNSDRFEFLQKVTCVVVSGCSPSEAIVCALQQNESKFSFLGCGLGVVDTNTPWGLGALDCGANSSCLPWRSRERQGCRVQLLQLILPLLPCWSCGVVSSVGYQGRGVRANVHFRKLYVAPLCFKYKCLKDTHLQF